jgi:HAE1 family hydrophobic/amphiphilic exporter-1
MSPRDIDHSGKLTRFSLDRHITVLVLLVSILVIGTVAAVGIPLELIPRGFSEPFLGVRVDWRDAPAPEAEEKIAIPLEEELSSIRGIEGINSFSYSGGVRVWMRFKQGTDMNVAYREVQDRIERARLHLPDDVERIWIRKDDDSGIPVAVLGVAVDPNTIDIYNLVQKEIILPIERVEGVASVEVQGLEEKEILIELDRRRVEAAGLNIYDLSQELSSDNFTMASGTVRYGARKLLLRSIGRYEDLETIENLKVARDLRLKDIATVTYEEPEKRYRVRVNSRPAFAVVVLKEGQANTMEVSERVNAILEKLQTKPSLQNTLIISLFNQGNIIGESLSTLLNSGKIGGLLAILVLFAFLRRFRLTAIITLSIPLSIIIGLAVMFFVGESLNILTLLGLMICVGLLVDNSVVVAENIFRLHREGMERREACIKGAGEIALAITMATLTTIVVFLPVSLVDGQGQFFLLRLAIPVTVSLSASLLVALVFIPLAVYLTLPAAGNGRRRKVTLFRRLHDKLNAVLHLAYDKTLLPVNHGYTRVLGFFLRRRLDLVLGIVALFVLTIAVAFANVKMTPIQEEERGGFELDIEFPRSTTLPESVEWFDKAERMIESKKEELGLEGYFVVHWSTGGELEGWFTNPRTSELSPREVTEIIKKALPMKPGMQVFTGEESEVDQDKGKSVHVVTLQGDQHEPLEKTAEELGEFLVSVDGVLGIKKSADREPQEVALEIDRELSQRHGVNPAVVAGVVGYALRGTMLPRYHKDGKEIPVRVRFREEDREDLQELASFAVPAAEGTVPLSSVTNATVVPTMRGVFRQNKRVTRNITLELEEGKEEDTREMLTAIMGQIDLPEGITFGASAQQQSQGEEQQAMLFAALFSIIFIYLLMGYLFESFILPLSIILTIPLAAIGVGWTHFFMGLNIDFLGMVGAILLIGVVVNNGIVLIDYVNRLRGQGHAREEAILLAADRRFRPIMMTALTTIFGMFPLLMGGGSSIGISYTSFGLTLIGGMTTATLLTLLVVPVFYTLFDDGRQTAMAAIRRGLGREPEKTADATGSAPGS